MEQTLKEVEDIIREYEKRIALYRRQLQDHEEGIRKLSPMVRTSSETKLENAQEALEEYKLKQQELLSIDAQILVEKEQKLIKERRKKYFDNQLRRIKLNREHSKDIKVEVLTFIEELPADAQFEDEELYDMAYMSLKLSIREHEAVFLKYNEIKKDFFSMIKTIDESLIDDIKILNIQIPIVVLYFSFLLSTIKESIEKENKGSFSGFPKYQDWWINELWSSHLAYFALYKWRDIIKHLCKTDNQRNIWEKLFKDWVELKKALNQKGSKGFAYTVILDQLLIKYAELEEEINNKHIVALEQIIKRVAIKENFAKVKSDHDIETAYLLFKKDKD